MIINSNIDAMKSLRSLNNNTRKMDKNMEKLSSGMKINRAADDSAGLSISTKMRAQIRGLAQDERNIDDGVSMFNTAEGGMSQIENMIHRIRELAVQSASDTNTDDDRAKMQEEVKQLIDGIDGIAYDTEFNTHKVLRGKLTGPEFNSSVAWDNPSILSALTDIAGNWDTHIAVPPTSYTSSGGDGALNSRSSLIVTDAEGNAIGGTNSFGIDAYIQANYGNLPQTFVNSPTLANAKQLATAIAAAMTASIRATPSLANLNLTVTGKINSSGEFSFTVQDAKGDPFGVEFGGCSNQGLIDSTTGSRGSIAHQLLHSTFGSNLQLGDPTQEYVVQVGPNTDQNILFKIPAMRAEVVGEPPTQVIANADISTQSKASDTIALCDIALDYVSNGRSLMGAHVNRLESAKSGVNNYHQNLSAAESRIRDTNMSKEMTEQVKNNILMQSATAMLAQANQRPENILQILR